MGKPGSQNATLASTSSQTDTPFLDGRYGNVSIFYLLGLMISVQRNTTPVEFPG